MNKIIKFIKRSIYENHNSIFQPPFPDIKGIAAFIAMIVVIIILTTDPIGGYNPLCINK